MREEMLGEVLAVGRDLPADKLPLVSKPFEQGPGHRVKVPEADQRFRDPWARRMGQ
jgi:hypothetical protein